MSMLWTCYLRSIYRHSRVSLKSAADHLLSATKLDMEIDGVEAGVLKQSSHAPL